ncbi:MAG: sigma-70 family RNA polymerase sigma factor, partial [Muribaculaceae bacterium]|nr:sigma-70 family RNA polymerase sigma factor [Muribaculaceae bacterium]
MEIEELINRGEKGDENALCHLYNTYSHKMMNICVKIVGNRMIAEELTHDAFILAFSKLNQLQNPKRFEKWLSTIVSNISFRYLEQNEKYNTISLSDLNEKETPHNYDSHTFESEQKMPLDIKDILLAIEQLPKGYQSVFKMSVLQGMSHNEIADILGIAARSSASQLARAKRLLRQHLSKYLVALLVIITAPIIYFLSKQRNTNNAIHTIVSKNDEPDKESEQLPDSSSIVTPPSVTKT